MTTGGCARIGIYPAASKTLSHAALFSVSLEAEAKSHLKPIEAMVTGSLPPNENFELLMRLGSMQGLRGASVRRVHDILVPWIKVSAPHLPIARPGRYITPLQWTWLPGLEFDVSLHRSEAYPFPGRFKITQLAPEDIEEKRLARILEALVRKTPKLAIWKLDHSAHTVLVLEENDIFITNENLVAEAVLRAENMIEEKPDEIYVISTATKQSWWITPIRVGQLDYWDIGDPTEINPSALRSITAR